MKVNRSFESVFMRWWIPLALLVNTSTIAHAQETSKWIADTRTGCKVWNDSPNLRLTIQWTGSCNEKHLATGNGVLRRFKDGSAEEKYEGEMKNGKQEGWGTYNYADGCSYDGEWKDGSPDGRGTMHYSNGDSYSGDWNDGQWDGRGTMHFANGGFYESEWKDGEQLEETATHDARNKVTTQAARAEEEQEKEVSEAAKAAEQERINNLIAKGKPAQIYIAAMDFVSAGKTDVAEKLYKVLIDKYPDSPYTLRAIDDRNAARQAARQREEQQAQEQAQEQARAQAEAQAQTQAQAMAQAQAQQVAANRNRCLQACSAMQEQCLSQVGAQSNSAQISMFGAAISGNYNGALQNMANGMSNESAGKSQCASGFGACTASCD
ncbi:MORN repeat-containing protein [Burkholderiales bacterium GJ-E10]|nr:MORN repeat-containing protein [Burkholderiales bacterium GJ-E10]